MLYDTGLENQQTISMLTQFCTATIKREAARELMKVIERDRFQRKLREAAEDRDKKAEMIAALMLKI